MEIVEQEAPNQSKYCKNCTKKQQLIEKYENLITLLKKKADRSQISQLSASNKLSFGDRTTSHTSFNGSTKNSRFILAFLLSKLESGINSHAFYQIKSESYLKNYKKGQNFLTKLNNICLNKQRQHFSQMKSNQKQGRNQNILCSQSVMDNNQLIQEQPITNKTVINSRQKSETLQNSPSNKKSVFIQPHNSFAFDHANYKSLTYVHEDLITSLIPSDCRTLRQQSLPLLFMKRQSSSTNHLKSMYKKLFIMQQENFFYQQKIKSLEHHMEQALTRQIKQNRKKTESLQMVAEEMAQKNDIIIELQQKITMLEEKYCYGTNVVLEDQLTQHRKEVEKLEKVNIRLDNQLRRVRDKVIYTQDKLKLTQLSGSKLTQQNIELKQALFQMQQKILSFSRLHQTFQKSSLKIQKTLQKLKNHQKSLSRHHSSHQNCSPPFLGEEKISSLEQFYKLELIFIYLYNIEDENYTFAQHEHVFDEEQLEVLKELKVKIKDLSNKLENKVDLMQTINNQGYGLRSRKGGIHQGRLSDQGRDYNGCVYKTGDGQDINYQEGIYCHQNMVDGSIFQVLNEQRDNHSNVEVNAQLDVISRATARIQPQQNLTMKLLQMQIQKNKQIQKICQLKQKNMYIRNILLNLIKSLQLKQNSLKTQTTGILDLIFDVYEFSEEEKQICFSHANIQTKERKFFGFI